LPLNRVKDLYLSEGFETMKAAAVERGNMSPSDLEDLFFSLEDVLSQYDWLISDTDLFFKPAAPQALKDRLNWTGLLMRWDELETVFYSQEWHMISGVLSALPKGISEEAAQQLPLPKWDYEGYWNGNPQMQTSLTQVEVVPCDGYLLLFLASGDALTDRFLRLYPKAMELSDYIRKQTGNV
jgi:hypothetical protein